MTIDETELARLEALARAVNRGPGPDDHIYYALKLAEDVPDLCKEVRQLRASLADAVAKIAAMEPVCTEALARRRAFHARHQDEEGAWEEYDRAREAFSVALDRYEAWLTAKEAT